MAIESDTGDFCALVTGANGSLPLYPYLPFYPQLPFYPYLPFYPQLPFYTYLPFYPCLLFYPYPPFYPTSPSTPASPCPPVEGESLTAVFSGLGFAIACRLLTDFLETRPAPQKISLVFTTRDSRKADATAARLRAYLQRKKSDVSRVTLRPETVSLTSLLSVKRLSERLLAATPRLDVVVLNAGAGGFTGIDWALAVWKVMTDWLQATTWPTYKLSGVGYLTARQLPDGLALKEPELGEIFCSNVFGHYMLVHKLAPILSRDGAAAPAGRVVWLSSLEAYAHALAPSDMQGLRSPMAYECSKRLTDVLALTSHLPSTRPFTSSFLATEPTRSPPKMFLAHPGICATSIVPLPPLLWYAMAVAFYVARWLGSVWHTVRPYSGACAPTWIALSPAAQLDAFEHGGARKGKWGSSTDVHGRDRVARTEVEGWGFGGRVGEEAAHRTGRKRGAVALTGEALEEFELLGRDAWREMERLRKEWEGLLEGL
ncbi:MAG: 3-keto-steroid reductase [Thelocarpon impressellum]|nr:MAG: 3-keto-steroid reductase [Thelocarpon impressellum]